MSKKHKPQQGRPQGTPTPKGVSSPSSVQQATPSARPTSLPDQVMSASPEPASFGGAPRAAKRMEDLTQRRQQYAWKRVSTRWDKNAKNRVQGVPLQVRTQGLTTCLAVLLRENRSESLRIAEDLSDWLLTDSPAPVMKPSPGELSIGSSGERLLNALLRLEEGNMDQYYAAEQEALRLLAELKLLASARFASRED